MADSRIDQLYASLGCPRTKTTDTKLCANPMDISGTNPFEYMMQMQSLVGNSSSVPGLQMNTPSLSSFSSLQTETPSSSINIGDALKQIDAKVEEAKKEIDKKLIDAKKAQEARQTAAEQAEKPLLTTGEKALYAGKGAVDTINPVNWFTSTDEKGKRHFSWTKTLTTVGIGVGIAAVEFFTGGAATPYILWAGVALGAGQTVNGAVKASEAKTKEEAKEAYKSIGGGLAGTGLSLVGVRSLRGAKAATACKSLEGSTSEINEAITTAGETAQRGALSSAPTTAGREAAIGETTEAPTKELLTQKVQAGRKASGEVRTAQKEVDEASQALEQAGNNKQSVLLDKGLSKGKQETRVTLAKEKVEGLKSKYTTQKNNGASQDELGSIEQEIAKAETNYTKEKGILDQMNSDIKSAIEAEREAYSRVDAAHNNLEAKKVSLSEAAENVRDTKRAIADNQDAISTQERYAYYEKENKIIGLVNTLKQAAKSRNVKEIQTAYKELENFTAENPEYASVLDIVKKSGVSEVKLSLLTRTRTKAAEKFTNNKNALKTLPIKTLLATGTPVVLGTENAAAKAADSIEEEAQAAKKAEKEAQAAAYQKELDAIKAPLDQIVNAAKQTKIDIVRSYAVQEGLVPQNEVMATENIDEIQAKVNKTRNSLMEEATKWGVSNKIKSDDSSAKIQSIIQDERQNLINEAINYGIHISDDATPESLRSAINDAKIKQSASQSSKN